MDRAHDHYNVIVVDTDQASVPSAVSSALVREFTTTVTKLEAPQGGQKTLGKILWQQHACAVSAYFVDEVLGTCSVDMFLGSCDSDEYR